MKARLEDLHQDWSRVEADPRVLSSLNWDVWKHLDVASQTAAAEAVKFEQPLRFLGVQHFGPQEELQATAQWRDEETGLVFSLIPGGVFQPGYDSEQLELLGEVGERLTYRDEDDEPSQPSDISTLYPYLSSAGCSVALKAEARIGPFLMATTPVLQSCQVVRQMTDVVDDSRLCECDDDAYPVEWFELPTLLQRFCWALPSSAEFEWALRGRRNTLFYWGNHASQALHRLQPARDEDLQAMEQEHAEALLFSLIGEEWPILNRWGLSGMVSMGSWCLPSLEAHEKFPLRSRGGAGYCYPWQDCGEWLLLLNAVERLQSLTEDYGTYNGLRPILRIREVHS